MNTLKLLGKHLHVEADLGRFYGGAYPFPLVMLLDGHVVVGMCWKKWSSGKLTGAPGDPYGVVQDLLDSIRFFMRAKPGEVTGVKRETVREYGFRVEEDSLIYSATSIADSVYIFLERTKDSVKVHYYNRLLDETDCLEFKGKQRSTIELPFVEFVEDVLRISGEYLKNYASTVEQIMMKQEEEPYDHDVLWEWYREIKELHQKRIRSF